MRRGFTLIELLMAMALAVVVISMLGFIYGNSREIFNACQRTVELYQKIVNTMGLLESELQNVRVTHDMEFFADGQPWNRHFDEKGLVSGLPYSPLEKGSVRGLRSHLPTHLRDLLQYVPSFAIYGDSYTDKKGVKHRSDVLYFKALTSVAGAKREALVLYRVERPMLSGGKVGTPVLKKYVLVRKGTGQFEEVPSDESGTDICVGVTDFKVEYFYHDPYTKQPPKWVTVPEGQVRTFCYLGWARVDKDRVIWVPDEDGRGFDDIGFNDKFAQLSVGSRILLYHGRPHQKDSGSQGLPQERVWNFGNDGDYTIIKIERASNQVKLRVANTNPPLPIHQKSVRFRAGFLPSAVRLTLGFVDAKGRRKFVTSIVYLASR